MYPPRRPLRRCIRYWIYWFKYGFFPCDCWNLDHELAVWLVPRLKLFRKNSNGCPAFLHNGKPATMEDWDRILGEMIEGFELKIKEWSEYDPVMSRKIELAFRHLGHYGQNLWD